MAIWCDIGDINVSWREDLSLIPYIYCAHKDSLNKWIDVSSDDLQNDQYGDLTFPNWKKVLFR